MKNYKRYLKAIILSLFLLPQIVTFAQTASQCAGTPTQNCTPLQGLFNAVADPNKHITPGDELCQATKLKTGLSCTQFSLDTSTLSSQTKPACWGTAPNRDVWLWFIATAQDMTISTDAILFNLATQKDKVGFGVYNTQLALYQSTNDTCTGTVSQMACDDNSGINGTNVPLQSYGPPQQAVIEVTGLIPGKKYFIRVAGGAAPGGNFCVSAFDTYTPGSKPCEAQVVHPNKAACAAKSGNQVINYTSTNVAPFSTDGIQPNAYVPVDPEYIACGGGISAGQYGTWTKFFDSLDTKETITNLSGGTRVYTLFSSTTCLHLTCMGSYTVSGMTPNNTVTITAPNKGSSYYILTTLLPGDMTQTFTTTLCVQNSQSCKALPTAKNLGGVVGAGGNVTGDADDYANGYTVTQKQVYVTTTYCKNADGSTAGALGQCNQGPNVWFNWHVPPTYPKPGQAFFQMWNKNCTGGPLNQGTDMPVATCTSNSQCYNFSEPSTYTGKTGHLDWSTNIGWDPNDFSCEYWGIFTGHAGEVCDFNFEVNDSPSLAGVEATQATICFGSGPVQVCGKYATGYEWSTGETTTCITVNPSVSTSYTVTATSGADGYDIAYVTVLQLPEATIAGNYTVCKGVTAPTFTLTGKYAGRLPYTFTYNVDNGPNQTVKSSGAINAPAGNLQSAVVSYTTSAVGTHTITLLHVQESSSQGCEQDQTGMTTIVVNPIPTATITGTVRKCLNDSPDPKIYFTGAGGTNPYSFIYKLNGGVTKTVTSALGGNIDSSTVVSTATATVSTFTLVSVSDGLGCSQTLASSAATTATVTVDNLRAGSLVANPAVVCQNSSPAPTVTFGGSAGTPGYTFTYKLNSNPVTTISSGSATSTVLTIPTSAVLTNVYTVSKVTDAGGLTCNSIVTTTVTVGPIPTATISGTFNQCLNDPNPPILFKGTGTSPFIFTYNINGAANKTVATAPGSNTVTVSALTNVAGTFTYSLVNVQDAACSQNQSGSAVVTINPMGGTIASNTTVCQNAAAPTITFSGSGGVAPYKFIYAVDASPTQTLTSNGTGTVTGTATTTAPTSTPGNSVYTLSSIQDNNGLTCASVSTITITTNVLPTATIAGDVTKCLNDPQPAITFTGAGTSDPYTFTYTINDGTNTSANKTVTSAVGSSTVTVSAPTSPSGTFTYSLVSVKDGTSATCSQNQTGTAVVKVNPLAATIAGTTTVCQNSTQPTITLTGTGGVPPYTFTYSIDGVTQSTPLISDGTGIVTTTAPTPVTGKFVYAISSVEDATSLSCISVSSVTITVSALPTASITGTATRCLNGPNPTITFTGAGTKSPYLFTYDINGTVQSPVVSTGNTATVSAPTNPSGVFNYNLLSVQDATAQTCSQTQSGTAVVTVNPLTASTTGNATVCKGTGSPNITFTGAGGTAPYVFIYNINGGANQTTSPSTGNSIVLPVSTTVSNTYTYSITSVIDAASLVCPSASGAMVRINDLPNAMVTGAAAACQGTTAPNVTFTGSNTTGPYTIDYTLNGAATSTVTSAGTTGTATFPVPTNVTPGTYNYTLVRVTDASSTACVNNSISGSQTFTINPLPTGTITTTTSDICQDMAGSVTFAGTLGTPPFTFSYTRTLNGGTPQAGTIVSGASTTTVLSIPANSMTPGVYTYSLVSVTDALCTKVQSGVGTVTVTVYPLPTASVSPTQTPICATDVITINNAASTGSSIVWTEDGAGSITAGGTTNSPTYTAAAGDAGNTVTLTMTVNSPNCTTTAIKKTTVYVYPKMVADLSVTHKVCQNDVAQLNLNVTAPGATPYTFTYLEGSTSHTVSTIGSNPLAVVGLNTSIATSPNKIPYMLTEVRDANNCYWPLNVADSMLVVPLPDAIISGGGDACKDSVAPVLNFIGTVGSKPFRFTFDINGKDSYNVSTSSNDSIKSYITSTSKVGTFVYSLNNVIDANNCPKPITGQTKTIIVGENPQAGFKITPERTSILEPTIDISNYSIGAKTYLWNFGDNSGISVSENPKNHTYADTGTYKIRLMTTNGKCKDSTFQIVRVYDPLVLYVPSSFSPNDDGINDEFKAEGDGFVKFEMMIFDRWGQLVFESNDINKGWNGKAKGGSQIAQMDSYIYVVNVRAINDKHDYTYRGVVTLMK